MAAFAMMMHATTALITTPLTAPHNPQSASRAALITPRTSAARMFVEDEDPAMSPPAMLYRKTEGGLSFKDLEVGEGGIPAADEIVDLRFTATIMSTGSVVDGTGARPVTFQRGSSGLGLFDEAIDGMKVGGKRRVLVLPSSKFVQQLSGRRMCTRHRDSSVAKQSPVQVILSHG